MFLISHFYNEEFLLPHWIKHHKPLFDHAVLIDYHSTDRSVEIIKKLAPEWEIRTTRNRFFEEPDIGNEIEDIEKEFTGWKIALNITEFIFHPDLRKYVLKIEKMGLPGVRSLGAIIVDRKNERSEFKEPLALTKTFGYMETDVFENPSTTGHTALSRSRLLHNQPSGQYLQGRHLNRITQIIDDELILLWFGWAPFDFIKERKCQIQTKVCPNKAKPFGWDKIYMVDDTKLEEMYKIEHERSYDLLSCSVYKEAYDKFKTYFEGSS